MKKVQEKKISNAKRIVALFIAVAIATAFSLSALFIVEYSSHSCSHQDCQICYQIGNSIRFFDNNTPQPKACIFAFCNIFALVLLIGESASKKVLATEITLKDKLLN